MQVPFWATLKVTPNHNRKGGIDSSGASIQQNKSAINEDLPEIRLKEVQIGTR
jgi:hypothetical protein